MTVRAKFRVSKIERFTMSLPTGLDSTGNRVWADKEVRSVHLNPVSAYNGGSPEDAEFWASTPSGTIQLGCATLEAAQQFELDKTYYVEFSPAE